MIKQKKGSALIWIIIIGILIAIGIGIYFLFFGGDVSSIANAGSSSIPQPPALPN